MKLIDFINKYHKGNVTAFARDNDIKHRQQVEQMIERGNYRVEEIEEELELIQVKRKIKRITK
jgi:predicted DNA-binding protein YlxM (UPF0122 family)